MSLDAGKEVQLPEIFEKLLLRRSKEILDDPSISNARKEIWAEVGHLEILASTYVGLNRAHAEKSPQWYQLVLEKQAGLEAHRFWIKKASARMGYDVPLIQWFIANEILLGGRRLNSSTQDAYLIYRISIEMPTVSDTSLGKSAENTSSEPSSSIPPPSEPQTTKVTLVGEDFITLLVGRAHHVAPIDQASDTNDDVWIPLQAQSSSQNDLPADVPAINTKLPRSDTAFRSPPVAKRILIEHILEKVHCLDFKVVDLDLQIEHRSSFLQRDQFLHVCRGGFAQLRVGLAKIAMEDPEVNWDDLPSASLEVLLDALLDDSVNAAILEKAGFRRAYDHHSINEKDWALLLGGLFWILCQRSIEIHMRKRPFKWAASTYTTLIRSTHELGVELASKGLLGDLEASNILKTEDNPESEAAIPAPSGCISMMALARAHSTSTQPLGKSQVLVEGPIAIRTPQLVVEEANDTSEEQFELSTMLLPPSSSGVLRKALIDENPSDLDSVHSDLSDSTNSTESDDSEATQPYTEQTLSLTEATATPESQSNSNDKERSEPNSDDSDLWEEVQIGSPEGSPPITQNCNPAEGHPDNLVENASNGKNYKLYRALGESAHSSTFQNPSSAIYHDELKDGDTTVSVDVLDGTDPVPMAHPPPAIDHPTRQPSNQTANNTNVSVTCVRAGSTVSTTSNPVVTGAVEKEV